MPATSVQIPWGSSQLSLSLPKEWQLLAVLEPASIPPVQDAVAEVQRALAQPTGSAPLTELAGSGMKVALVIDDASRPTPVSLILPIVLAQLEQAGVSRQDITVVPAIGLHREMQADEVTYRTGLEGLKFENPDCDDLETMMNFGVTSRGTPVWINRTVANADLVVSIGCIEPHIIASFGGGYKNIVPGTAGRQTVAHNHSLNCSPGTFNMVGQPIENNPMRLDLEEAAARVKGKVFIVNAILDYRQCVVQIAAGHPIDAHRAGVKTSAALYGVQINQLADVVITASNPMDSDLRQGVKALANTIRAVKPGGMLLTLVKADEGVGVFGLANRKLPVGRAALQGLAPLLVRLVPRLKLNGMGEEDRFFLYFALQAMRQAKMLMYAPTIPESVKQNLPFVQFYSTPEEALALARRRFSGRADVLVFPHGGITFPHL